MNVALRKESVDRNAKTMSVSNGLKPSLSARRAWIEITLCLLFLVGFGSLSARRAWIEMNGLKPSIRVAVLSLSARRAWIEINVGFPIAAFLLVALRKESVDRNYSHAGKLFDLLKSLSARRAWIEMECIRLHPSQASSRSPQGERG